MNKPNIRTLVREAQIAFWDVVVRHYPQAETGDLSPWATAKLRLAAEAAVEEWIANNVPPEREDRGTQSLLPKVVQIGYRFKLARPVDRFPDFLVPAELTGTVTDTANGIWAEMNEHIAGAEAWDNALYWDTEEDFLQDTESLP